MKKTMFALILTAIALPAGARADWIFRLQAMAVDAPDGISFTVFDTSVDIDYDTGVGLAASIEYRFTERLGLDLAAYFVEHDVAVSARGPGTFLAAGAGIELIPTTLGLVFHATPRHKVDVYLLAGIGTVSSQSGPQRFSDQIVTAGLGLDAAIGEDGWAVSSSLRWIEGTADTNFEIGPLWSLGVAHRF